MRPPVRVLVIADIDDLHWRRGDGSVDLVLSCGDVADQLILEAAQAHGCQHIFAVKGNHDRDLPFEDSIRDLHLRVLEHGGVSFGGLRGSWQYKPRGHFLYEQDEVTELLAAFPPVDVLVSHNSPRGIHDKDDGIHIGFDGLTAYIERTAPTVVIHGHQHVAQETTVGSTRVVGVYGHQLLDL